jgi:malate dehydrogenase (oxaloacetate-decarboxylating)(NADP+)
MYPRGCYISIVDRGNIKKILAEYANAQLPKGPSGKPLCDCIVFSDGGRILGLGDLGAYGMGIPIGKLDLYTACGGFNPHRTIPLILDVGCGDPADNTAHLDIRESEDYTGTKQRRQKHRSEAGTLVNSCYYGPDSMITELMDASVELFGKGCLLQFEDFNSNDAFPLLAEYRSKYLTYNDDIQGTAAICVAGLMGAIKLKKPNEKDLIGAMRDETVLFHGAGSANLGALSLIHKEGKVPMTQLFVTNSKGLIWKNEGEDIGAGAYGRSVSDFCRGGNYRNDEQKEFAYEGTPDFDCKTLKGIIEKFQPTCLVGAVGVSPGCFDRAVIEAMMKANTESGGGLDETSDDQGRPVIFAMSNPKSQAEITAKDCYEFSKGSAIYGAGTYFEPVEYGGRLHAPGQTNNVYIFPGVSFGSMICSSKTIPDRFFMVAAEAVANSLNEEDMQLERVIPDRKRLREVNTNVAVAVVLEAQKMGLATKILGASEAEVREAVKKAMWEPGMPPPFGGA